MDGRAAHMPTIPGNAECSLWNHRADRLLVDRHGARTGILQEVRNSIRSISKEASWAVIRDKTEARRKPGDAHADRHAVRLDDGAARLAGEADGHSVDAQSQRPGDHAQQQTEASGREDRRRTSSRSRTRRRPRRSADVRDDIPARHARDVDALLAGVRAGSIPTRTSP